MIRTKGRKSGSRIPLFGLEQLWKGTLSMVRAVCSKSGKRYEMEELDQYGTWLEIENPWAQIWESGPRDQPESEGEWKTVGVPDAALIGSSGRVPSHSAIIGSMN